MWAKTSGVLVASGQSIDVRIVEKCVVAVPPGEGLGADAEVVVGDELWALSVASVHPAVEGAEGHAGQSQHKGQEAPGVGAFQALLCSIPAFCETFAQWWWCRAWRDEPYQSCLCLFLGTLHGIFSRSSGGSCQSHHMFLGKQEGVDVVQK